ncbi:PhzF family phenazine biosynthesis protein [Methylocystis heyeri]|uniref:PhzF family phenazine biosynthesis protein n=1 Tax=Methylocystis heyeri TaxID=391905 RepID=UPI0011372297|nr:PhzF family phenazine biosynthesis isomerase [Methylocystis heyeri]
MTRPLQFHAIDVFTSSRLSGSPLAVVDAAGELSASQMRAIASEFGFPVTAFLRASRDPVNSAGLRVFTRSGEASFSAEAVIGVAVLLAETRAGEVLSRRGVVIALELGGEVYSCEVIRNSAGVSYAQFTLRRLPSREPRPLDPLVVAAALGLAAADIGFDWHAPCLCSLFSRFAFIPVGGRRALEKACPMRQSWPLVFGRDAGVCLYTADALAPESALHIRSFRVEEGEDCANGEALAAFAAAACAFESPQDGEHQMFIEQGHNVGRASRLTLGLGVQDGRLAEIRLGGQATPTMRGELKL